MRLDPLAQANWKYKRSSTVEVWNVLKYLLQYIHSLLFNGNHGFTLKVLGVDLFRPVSCSVRCRC